MKFKDRVMVIGGFYAGLRGELRVELKSVGAYAVLTNDGDLVTVDSTLLELEVDDAEDNKVQESGRS